MSPNAPFLMAPGCPAPINWNHLQAVVAHFTGLGFTYVEAPWFVQPQVSAITCNRRQGIISTDLGDLIGSSEQSFIQMHAAGILPAWRYVALTPCFRNEHEIDLLHSRWFMKAELFINDSPEDPLLQEIVSACREHFDLLAGRPGITRVVVTHEGFDLTVNDIEVGSYGLRRHGSLHWLYATALAEPRFSIALGS